MSNNLQLSQAKCYLFGGSTDRGSCGKLEGKFLEEYGYRVNDFFGFGDIFDRTFNGLTQKDRILIAPTPGDTIRFPKKLREEIEAKIKLFGFDPYSICAQVKIAIACLVQFPGTPILLTEYQCREGVDRLLQNLGNINVLRKEAKGKLYHEPLHFFLNPLGPNNETN